MNVGRILDDEAVYDAAWPSLSGIPRLDLTIDLDLPTKTGVKANSESGRQFSNRDGVRDRGGGMDPSSLVEKIK